jgi:hypothetical protein
MTARLDVVVIVNANARRFVERRGLLVDLDRLLEGRAILHVTRTRRELTLAAEDCRARGARVVVLCGGDGTYGAGATALVDAFAPAAPPLIALAPGGTVGTIARALAPSPGGDLGSAISRIVHGAVSGAHAVAEVPTLSVTSRSHAADRRRIGFVFGTGLVASFFELYDPSAIDRPDGPSSGGGIPAAAKIVARVFAESFVGGPLARRILEPMPCAVEIDGARLPWPASSLVVASVLRDLGLGMRVTHRGSEDPERPHVVVSGLPPRSLGPRLPRVLRGVPIGDPGEPHFDGLAARVVVDFGEARGRYVIDGDLDAAEAVVVEAGPRLRLAVSPT